MSKEIGKPKSQGLYLYTCAELDGGWEHAAVTFSDKTWWVHEEGLGVTPLDNFDDGLIDIKWSKVA